MICVFLFLLNFIEIVTLNEHKNIVKIYLWYFLIENLRTYELSIKFSSICT